MADEPPPPRAASARKPSARQLLARNSGRTSPAGTAAAANLRRAYATSLTEPLPPSLAELLRRLE